jgi:hypothetical protein
MNPTALKQAFDRDGFAVIAGYLPADEVAETRDRSDRYLAEILPVPAKSRTCGS